MAIGDRINPGLGRADTSGILRGSMAGAEALGQGIAALGAGVGAGIKQRKKDEKEVTATVARLEALKKAQAPDSPLIGVLDEGINTLSNPDLSPRKAAGLAAGYNQSVTDFFDSVESGIRQAEATRAATKEAIALPALRAEMGMRASGPEAMSKAAADVYDTAGDPEALAARISDRIEGIRDPEGWQQKQSVKKELIEEFQSPQGMFMDPSRVDKAMELMREPVPTIPIGEMVPEVVGTDMGDLGAVGILPPLPSSTKEQRIAAYLQEVNKLQAQTGGGAITFDEFEDLDPQSGKVVKRQFMKQGGRIVKELPTVPKTSPFATPEQQAQAAALAKRYGSAEERTQFAIKTGQDSKEALVKIDAAIDLLADDEVYTGAFSGVRERFLSMIQPFGFSETWERKLAKAEVLGVFLGDFVMARVAQTKGAISEKEMDLFAKWAAGGSKSKAGNLRILQALRKVETRRIALSKEANRLMREDPNRNAVELNFLLQDWMDTEDPLFEESEINTLGGGGSGGAESPNQEQAAVELGEKLRKARAGGTPPAPQQPASVAEPAPMPAPEPEPLPSGKPFIPDGANEENTKLGIKTPFSAQLRSPHVGDRRLFLNLNDAAEKLGYQKAEDIPPGTVIADPHRPGKFVRIP